MIDASSALELNNPLWRFSLRAYALAGVAPSCLDLQNRYGMDVNLLLFWMWAGIDRGIEANTGLLEKADDHVAAWRENIVRPLRGARSWAKQQPFMQDEACFRLRENIKRQELEAERIQQAMLHQFSDGLAQTSLPRDVVVRRNVELLLRLRGVEEAAAITSLLSNAAEAACTNEHADDDHP